MNQIETRYERALMHLEKGNLRPAVKLLHGIVRDAPEHYDAVELLGRLALRKREFDFAKQLLKNAVKRWPTSARLKMLLGCAFLGLKRS